MIDPRSAPPCVQCTQGEEDLIETPLLNEGTPSRPQSPVKCPAPNPGPEDKSKKSNGNKALSKAYRCTVETMATVRLKRHRKILKVRLKNASTAVIVVCAPFKRGRINTISQISVS